MFALVGKLAVVATVAGPGFSKGIEDSTVARWDRAGGVGYLIEAAWTEGEAAERGIVLDEGDVKRATVNEHDGLSREDLEYEARVYLLKAALREPIEQAAAQSVTPEQIEAFVKDHPLSTQGERRAWVLKAPNGARAKAIVKALRRGVTWRKAGDRYAPHGPGGILSYVAPPTTRLDKAIFKAPRNRVTRYGRYVFKVVKDTPPGPLPAAQQRATAWEMLAGAAQAAAVDQFQAAMRAKWRPLTDCADPNRAPDFCANSPTG